ncbi:hypothetical protein PHMEG_00029122 [Phytophthora megakarya]|uniref:Uncharacterized protein n=1 Tax=Phytophthora megakarya TaxID=4795 RepID=A0A225V525_9STRA|nr:hypothetical protein PHMEG_00029122 [Phytophthora megakarya]
MGLRAPNELLRKSEMSEADGLYAYYERLLVIMEQSHEQAERARQREQERQARYYNRKVRNRRIFQVSYCIWDYNPPRGRTATKFVHQCMGPMQITEPGG